MYLISSVTKFYNSKLFFSKNELTKILECYSKGVSNGKWKDYAIISRKQEAIFCMFRHSMASPECILTKTNKYKKGSILFNLELNNISNYKFAKIEDLLAILKRKEIKAI